MTIDEHPDKGTVINVERKPSTAIPTGCGNCALPDCDCPHAISCEVKFDADDTSGQDFIELWNTDGTAGFGFFTFHTGSISIYGLSGGEIDIPVSGDFYGVWHSVCAQFCRSDDTHIDVTFTVDGVSDTGTMLVPAEFSADKIYAGAKYGGGVAHRTLRCVRAFGPESSFNFPTDSFDSLTGGASIVDGQLRIDSTDSVDAYGTKTLATAYSMTCVGACCSPYCSVMTEAECDAAGGTYQGDGTTCGDIDPCTECIQDDTLCVTFSGIETCHCYFKGGSDYFEISDVSMNGAFELTKTSGGAGIVQWEGAGGTVHLKKWADGICASEPDSECDCAITYIILQCVGPPYTEDISHYLGYFVLSADVCDASAGTINLFQSGGSGSGNVPLGTPESNLNDCYDTSHGTPLGQNGTATIISGGCP